MSGCYNIYAGDSSRLHVFTLAAARRPTTARPCASRSGQKSRCRLVQSNLQLFDTYTTTNTTADRASFILSPETEAVLSSPETEPFGILSSGAPLRVQIHLVARLPPRARSPCDNSTIARPPQPLPFPSSYFLMRTHKIPLRSVAIDVV